MKVTLVLPATAIWFIPWIVCGLPFNDMWLISFTICFFLDAYLRVRNKKKKKSYATITTEEIEL